MTFYGDKELSKMGYLFNRKPGKSLKHPWAQSYVSYTGGSSCIIMAEQTESSLEFTYKLKASLPTFPKLLKYSGFKKQGGLFGIEECSKLKTGSETLTWLAYWENSELSMTAGNTFIMERTGNWNAPYSSTVKQCPEWNDLMFHKCKDESKRRHHPQTTSPQKQSKGKAKCAISSVMEWKDVSVNRQPVSVTILSQ